MYYTHHEGANNNIGHLGELVVQEGCGCMISDLRKKKRSLRNITQGVQ